MLICIIFANKFHYFQIRAKNQSCKSRNCELSCINQYRGNETAARNCLFLSTVWLLILKPIYPCSIFPSAIANIMQPFGGQQVPTVQQSILLISVHGWLNYVHCLQIQELYLQNKEFVMLCVTHHPSFQQLFTFLCLCVQASEPSEHCNGQDSHTAAHTQSRSHSSSHSRATHSHTYKNPSTSSSSTHQTQTQGFPQHLPQVQAQSSDGGVPLGLASTLEHIIGQLDILTQVSRICVNPS